MEGALLLDVVVGQSATVLKLFTSEDETLLVRRNAFLVLDLGLDLVNRVGALYLKGDGLSGECLNKDLHPKFTLTLRRLLLVVQERG